MEAFPPNLIPWAIAGLGFLYETGKLLGWWL